MISLRDLLNYINSRAAQALYLSLEQRWLWRYQVDNVFQVRLLLSCINHTISWHEKEQDILGPLGLYSHTSEDQHGSKTLPFEAKYVSKKRQKSSQDFQKVFWGHLELMTGSKVFNFHYNFADGGNMISSEMTEVPTLLHYYFT